MSLTRAWSWTALVAILVTTGWFIYSRATFGGIEECTECGVESDFLSVFGIETSRHISSTPLSTMLSSHGIPGFHKHHWLFAAGGSSGSCALGRGQELWRTIRNPTVITFLDQLIRFGPVADSKLWVARSLDPKFAGYVESALISTFFPDTGFTNAIEFQKWWAANQVELDKNLLDFTK